MPKRHTINRSTIYSDMRTYCDYHNHQEYIPYSEFISIVVPAVAQFQADEFPRHFQSQMQEDIIRYGVSKFEEISHILRNGVWSDSAISTLAPKPTEDTLTSEWLPYWITHHLNNVENAYRNLCAGALHCESLTSGQLNATLKTIAWVNAQLVKHEVDLSQWHKKIERNHTDYSLYFLPYTLINIFENSASANTKMFSALKNPTIMTKSTQVLPPVVAGTLHALRKILGWGGAGPELPICKVSVAEVKKSCNDYKDFSAGVGQTYKNLQLRAHLFNTTIKNSPPSSKRKM